MDNPFSNPQTLESRQSTLLDGLIGSRAEVQPPFEGEVMGSLLVGAYGGIPGKVVGETWKAERAAELSKNSVAARDLASVHPEHSSAFKVIGKGAAVGVGAAIADVVVNKTLQEACGTKIAGRDLFRPTAVEEFGIAVTAAAPLSARLKIALTATSWLGGRVLNFYHGEQK